MASTPRMNLASGSALRRTPLDFAAIFAGMLLLTLLTVGACWQFWHAERIFTGVSIGAVPVGGLSRSAAVAKLTAAATAYSAPPVSVYLEERQWPLPLTQIDAQFDLLAAVNQAYLLGRQGTVAERLRQQLGLALAGHTIRPAIEYDAAELRYAISQVAASVRRPGRPAVTIGGTTVPAQPGLDVDEEATLSAVVAALGRQADDPQIRVPLAAVPMAPPEASTLASPSGNSMTGALAAPFLLIDPGSALTVALDPVTLEAALFSRTPLRLDREVLRGRLGQLANEIAVPVRDARLRFNPATGGLTVTRSSQSGRRLDIDATLTAVEAALVSGQTQATLVMVEQAPKVDMNRVAEMGIRELVASGATYYAGSSAERIHNIEVAAEKFAGVVIPPGDLFSFNEYVEDVSAANGFEDSLVIWGDRTAVGVGGGVCQVSTTIFRTAYLAGLPIVERYNHGYVVSWYGEPGMDATIYTPTVDFRFRNDTGAYLLLEPVVDSAAGVLTFNFYGTKPARTVQISEPVISEVVKPESPVYNVDEDLALGETTQVEWPKDGMTVKVERTIVENGTTRSDSIISRYQPWRAIYLVGPGTPIPEAVKTGG